MLDRTAFVSSREALRDVHGARLASLVGAELTGTWVAWDASDETWLADEAVILGFADVQLEIVWWKFGEVAISWNQVDVNARPRWLSDWQPPFDLRWRQQARPELAAVVGHRLTRVALVEYRFETTVLASKDRPKDVGEVAAEWILNGLEFQFGDLYLSVHNGLDENALSSDPVEKQPGALRRVFL